MTLNRLADEILILITKHICDEKDLNALVQTNRRFYNVLNASLYRHNYHHSGGSAFFWGIQHGQEATVRHAIAEGSLQTRNSLGEGPLVVAARYGQLSILKFLLNCSDSHLDINDQDKEGRTALSWAAANGDRAITQQLLSHSQCQPDLPSKGGQTPLTFAALFGHIDVVELLLSASADPHSADEHGWTPLANAARNNKERVVERLLMIPGIQVNTRPRRKSTPLMCAVRAGNERMITLLMEADGVEINGSNSRGYTALHLAASKGNESVARRLLAKGADVNRRTRVNITPLSLAMQSGHRDMVQLLKSSPHWQGLHTSHGKQAGRGDVPSSPSEV